MSVQTIAELTRYRWSSDDDVDRFSVENPATGRVITVGRGGSVKELNAAIEAPHRAFDSDWWSGAA